VLNSSSTGIKSACPLPVVFAAGTVVDHDAFACGQLHAACKIKLRLAGWSLARSRVVLLDHGHTYMDNEIVRCYSAMYCVPLPRQIYTTASARVDDHDDLLDYIRLRKLSASFKIKSFTT
jgi:hypothetical protein